MESYTAADGMIDALGEMGVTHFFANFGSDHPPIIESLAKAKARGKNNPRVVLCPHESVALAAAHGHALVSGQAQAVFVHCDVGTQTLGGSVHNACRARIPAFIFAGETSITIDGERFGGRNRPVQFIQDVTDQHSIVRPYVKWSYGLRTGVNIKQLTYRGMQLAHSAPRGPVYLSGPRETLEEPIEPGANESASWPTVEPGALSDAMLEGVLSALEAAQRPLLITSYLGRSLHGVIALRQLAERFAIGVVEASPAYVNMVSDHDCLLGDEAEPLLADADLVIVVDCDVPWISTLGTPGPDTPIYHIDVDPLKTGLPLWHVRTTHVCQADGAEVLAQLVRASEDRVPDASLLTIRRAWHERVRGTGARTQPPLREVLDAAFLSACVAEVIGPETIVLDETITSSPMVRKHIPRRCPGGYFQSGGSSLGWHGGAAIGAKLAAPERDVVALVGDGTYLFSVPSAVHWIARRYQTPFLTVIYNNGGWNATKQNVLKLHPDGMAARNDDYWVNLQNESDLPAIAAAAGGAYARTVERAQELREALNEAMAAVHSGRCAVIDVRLPAISAQID
ncbi:MAG: acetolactate synthase-1/2/3 large subunit [Gammaproteobacteria bacterium]|jgi:acetolactate synthase-1/2/3 large subunit